MNENNQKTLERIIKGILLHGCNMQVVDGVKFYDEQNVISFIKKNMIETRETAEKDGEQIKSLKAQVEDLKLKLENEILNSESLHRYWDRTKNELEETKLELKKWESGELNTEL